MTHANETKNRIMQSIADCKDDSLRAVLLLLLAVLEEIGGKIDIVMRDEKTLREIVLNGHTATHDSDHEWISNFRAQRNDEVCAWAHARMVAEEKISESKRRVTESILEKALVAAIAASGTLMLVGLIEWFRQT
jgi:hypothetical protein